MRINQNIAAFNSYRNLTNTQNSMAKSLEKLSSGFRINRAADDAAGLSISEGLRSQVGGLKQATRNAQDGISVVQTAEGALTEVHAMLQRMRDLGVQAANTGGNDATARTAIKTELDQLSEEITRIGNTTKFGENSLLNGQFGSRAVASQSFDPATVTADDVGDGFTISVDGGAATGTVDLNGVDFSDVDAANALVNQRVRAALTGAGYESDAVTASVTDSDGDGTVTLEFQSSSNFSLAEVDSGDGDTPLQDMGFAAAVNATATGSGGVFQVGADSGDNLSISVGDMRAAALGVDSGNLSVTDAAAAATTIDNIDDAIATVSDQRATLGAYQNRFEHTIANLQVATENLAASESRIRDTDMASEMVNFTRNQILQQAGTSMLAQANQIPQSVLSLLR